MNGLFSSISPRTFSISAYVFANILTEGLSIDEQNNIANWFELVGEVIIANAGQTQYLENIANNMKNNDNDNQNSQEEIKG